MKIRYKYAAKNSPFLSAYLDAMKDQETPTEYDFWSALWLIGLALGRDHVVARPRAPVYMNWYIILVAESGITRKSTAIRFAHDIALQMNSRLPTPFAMLEGRTTPEALERRLAIHAEECGESKAAIAISELVTFLGKERYNNAMPGLLTDLYDSPIERAGGTANIRIKMQKVFVTFLSASTPSWLIRAVHPSVIEGGFTSRAIFVVAQQRKKLVPWAEGEFDKAGIVGRLTDLLVQIRAAAPKEYTLSEEAMKLFTTWYKRKPTSIDAFRQSFESREDSHVLRLAACLAAAELRPNIERSHIRIAIDCVMWVKDRGHALFNINSNLDHTARAFARICSIMRGVGKNGIKQAELGIRMKDILKSAELLPMLETMHELNMLDKYEVKLGDRGRPGIVWRATKYLFEPTALSRMVPAD